MKKTFESWIMRLIKKIGLPGMLTGFFHPCTIKEPYIIKIEYALFASFAVLLPWANPGHACFMEMDDGATVDALLRHLGLPTDKAKMIFVNGRKVPEDTPLRDGDRVGIFPLVAGG